MTMVGTGMLWVGWYGFHAGSALAADGIAVAVVLYMFSRDRRYLRFIWQTVKLTILILAIVLIFFAFERLIGPML